MWAFKPQVLSPHLTYILGICISTCAFSLPFQRLGQDERVQTAVQRSNLTVKKPIAFEQQLNTDKNPAYPSMNLLLQSLGRDLSSQRLWRSQWALESNFLGTDNWVLVLTSFFKNELWKCPRSSLCTIVAGILQQLWYGSGLDRIVEFSPKIWCSCNLKEFAVQWDCKVSLSVY
jgi:hypothetical protein